MTVQVVLQLGYSPLGCGTINPEVFQSPVGRLDDHTHERTVRGTHVSGKMIHNASYCTGSIYSSCVSRHKCSRPITTRHVSIRTCTVCVQYTVVRIYMYMYYVHNTYMYVRTCTFDILFVYTTWLSNGGARNAERMRTRNLIMCAKIYLCWSQIFLVSVILLILFVTCPSLGQNNYYWAIKK